MRTDPLHRCLQHLHPKQRSMVPRPGRRRRLPDLRCQADRKYAEVTGTPHDALPGNQPFAHRFSSYIINAPGYIAHLSTLVQARGIPIIRHLVGHLDEAFDLPELGKVGLVVLATGLGARTLKGVEDEKMYPARGQTVLVKAPGVKRCIMQTEGFMAAPSLGGSTSFPKLKGRILLRAGRRPTAACIYHPETWARGTRHSWWDVLQILLD